jgi:hypothetical protein
MGKLSPYLITRMFDLPDAGKVITMSFQTIFVIEASQLQNSVPLELPPLLMVAASSTRSHESFSVDFSVPLELLPQPLVAASSNRSHESFSVDF